MFSRIRNGALAVVLIGAFASLTMAQGALLHKRVNYSINGNYRIGDYVLPPGNYVLYQISENDPNLFWLYQKDTAREPIAMIRTARIDYSGTNYPEKCLIKLDVGESCKEHYQVLRGWTIPGEGGWEVVGVVAKNDRILTRVK